MWRRFDCFTFRGLAATSSRVKAIACFFSVAICSYAGGAPVTLDHVARGNYRIDGSSFPTLGGYQAGDCRGTPCGSIFDDFRNYFVFDLSGVVGPFSGARLRAFNPRFGLMSSTGNSETYGVFDVSTPIVTLTSGTGGIGAHVDLGTGTEFGTITVSSIDDDKYLDIELNAAALHAINSATGFIAFGGSIVTLNAVADSEFLFAFSQAAGTPPTQLVLDSIVPEPATSFLMVLGLLLAASTHIRRHTKFSERPSVHCRRAPSRKYRWA